MHEYAEFGSDQRDLATVLLALVRKEQARDYDRTGKGVFVLKQLRCKGVISGLNCSIVTVCNPSSRFLSRSPTMWQLAIAMQTNPLHTIFRGGEQVKNSKKTD